VQGGFGFATFKRRAEEDALRIALIGQAAFAEKALTALVAHGEQVVHVFAPPDSPSGRPDPLKTKALELGLAVSQPSSFKGADAYEQFKSLGADLAVMAFVTLIVPESILYLPRQRSICFHPSLLPRHRGASAINWALIHGDAETGVTWFWPDKGIDTGPILIQKRVPIEPNDTVGSLYFGRLFALGIDSLIEAVELIGQGRAPRIPQDESLATYEPPCRDEHARVDFARPAGELHNLVRGCDPQPGAYAEVPAAARLRLYEPVLEAASTQAAAGTILSIDAQAMRIALAGGTLAVRRVRLEPEAKKVAPAELASRAVLKVGLKLL
jgi:methionyl-tRNA formyltransferase